MVSEAEQAAIDAAKGEAKRVARTALRAKGTLQERLAAIEARLAALEAKQ